MTSTISRPGPYLVFDNFFLLFPQAVLVKASLRLLGFARTESTQTLYVRPDNIKASYLICAGSVQHKCQVHAVGVGGKRWGRRADHVFQTQPELCVGSVQSFQAVTHAGMPCMQLLQLVCAICILLGLHLYSPQMFGSSHSPFKLASMPL